MQTTPAQVDISTLPFNYVQRGQDWVEGSNIYEQSPIDINTEQAKPDNDIMKFELFLADEELTGLTVLDTVNSIQVVGPFSKLYGTDIEGQTYEYEAVQFHFHAPSEHTINEGHYDLEMHIVHQITPDCFARTKSARNLAVVGIFFQVDDSAEAKDHPFLTVLEKPYPDEEFSMNFNEVFKNDLRDMMTYYAYKGSLTVPPCSANANWYVIEKPVKITRQQQEYFDFRWKDNPYYAGGHGNNRPVQPLAGRAVLKSTSCCIKGTAHEHERKLYLEKPPLPTEPASQIKAEIINKPQELSRSGSVYSNDSDGPKLGKEVPRELVSLGNFYNKARSVKGKSMSMHSKEVPKEVLMLREHMQSNEDKSKHAPTKPGLSRFGSVHAKLGGLHPKHETADEQAVKRSNFQASNIKKSDSIHSKDSHEDRPVIRESLYMKGTTSKQNSIYHVDEIPLDLLKFGSCFPADDTPISRGSFASKGISHQEEQTVNSPLQTRSGTTFYSKDVPPEVAEMLKNGLNLDEAEEEQN